MRVRVRAADRTPVDGAWGGCGAACWVWVGRPRLSPVLSGHPRRVPLSDIRVPLSGIRVPLSGTPRRASRQARLRTARSLGRRLRSDRVTPMLKRRSRCINTENKT